MENSLMSARMNEQTGRKLLAFPYFGGKYSHLDWLLPLLALPGINCFVDAFGGSGAVSLNWPLEGVQVYNDLHGEVVNFFRMLREHKALLIEQIALTPFSRREYELALQPTVTNTVSDIERARRFFVRARQVRSGLATVATPGRWAFCTGQGDGGISGGMGQTLQKYDNAIRMLEAVAQRLGRIYIESQPADEVMRRYDGPNTLHYLDPPYVHGTRSGPADYVHEMSDEQHIRLAYVARSLQGRVAISGYDCKLYRELYQGWRRFEITKTASVTSQQAGQRKQRKEVLWTNYKPQGQKGAATILQFPARLRLA
jgi:DNA adenine methylase